MRIGLLFILITSIIFSGCNQTKQSPSNKHLQQTNIFEIKEGNTLFTANNSLMDSLKNKKVVIKGRIHDTGQLNMFYVYQVDGNEVKMTRFFLDKRIFKEKYGYKWIELKGSITKVDKYNPEISVEKIKELAKIDKTINEAVLYTKQWVKANRKSFDLNEFKKTERFKKAFYNLKNKDLNATYFQESSSLTFIDFNKGILGVNCGCHVLGETEQRKDYLCFHAIYNYNHHTLQKVFVQNIGSFLE